ncbi:MAG: Jag N-terminal domain-containing protein [Ktedonobacteraceae bacterium]|nr:Jag N-terminal domain-containing protein [Ktedonobacteraceae bacterium]
MESIEASGKSVDEAVQQALARLAKRRDEVEVTVLQEPSRGAFGLGAREARVRLTVLPSAMSAVITPEMADAILGPADFEALVDEEELYEEEDQFADDEEFLDDEEASEFEEVIIADPSAPLVSSVNTPFQLVPETDGSPDTVRTDGSSLPSVETPSREDIEITVDVLQHILRYMNIHAMVQVRSTHPLTLNIHGINENLALLIGRRGETLAALQLLVNLIVSHRTKCHMHIIVDAENYRERREENLRSLALRVAQQVRNYRRSVALEAMPPHERRIVHIALAASKDISTESIGEGDERRVVISLKRPGR